MTRKSFGDLPTTVQSRTRQFMLHRSSRIDFYGSEVDEWRIEADRLRSVKVIGEDHMVVIRGAEADVAESDKRDRELAKLTWHKI